MEMMRSVEGYYLMLGLPRVTAPYSSRVIAPIHNLHKICVATTRALVCVHFISISVNFIFVVVLFVFVLVFTFLQKIISDLYFKLS